MQNDQGNCFCDLAFGDCDRMSIKKCVALAGVNKEM